jgi:omega-6 fatty acid desaturase (delta-12 desaturase)
MANFPKKGLHIKNSPKLNKINKADWMALVAEYQYPSAWRSIWQAVNTIIPFFFMWYLTYLSLSYSYWLTVPLIFITTGFLMRIFVIQHDCGHGSFFRSRKGNDYLGFVCGVLTLTPYHYWRKSHAIHHANASNLEHRGVGDVYTMTVKEYLQLSNWGKLKYRLYRHPLFLFGLAPTLLFWIAYRFPSAESKSWKKERASVWWTNIVLVTAVTLVIYFLGLQAFLLVHLPVTILGATVGAWLFFVQHQFEDTYWAEGGDWEYSLAALQGSSYYKLPKVLQWFTGNIGFHHIHHLSPRIPNYLLEKCHEENPILQEVVVLTLWSSFKTVFLSLWDEEQRRLVGFSHLKTIRQSSD